MSLRNQVSVNTSDQYNILTPKKILRDDVNRWEMGELMIDEWTLSFSKGKRKIYFHYDLKF